MEHKQRTLATIARRTGIISLGLILALSPLTASASSQHFTLTESDPYPNSESPGRWEYTARTDSPQPPTSQWADTYWRDAPWYWRHWDSSSCDNVDDLFPANPNSVDTDVSADGQTVTVRIYQKIDSVWVCFALDCGDGSYAYARMRNSQTEATVDSGSCRESNQRRAQPPIETISDGQGGSPGDQLPKLTVDNVPELARPITDPFGNLKAPAPSQVQL